MARGKKQETVEARGVVPVETGQPLERETTGDTDAGMAPEGGEVGKTLEVSGAEAPEVNGGGERGIPEGGETGPTGAVARALEALGEAKRALEALAAARREQRLSDTRARNAVREIREQIKVIRAYGD